MISTYHLNFQYLTKHSGKIAEKRILFTSKEQIDLAEAEFLFMFGTNEGKREDASTNRCMTRIGR